MKKLIKTAVLVALAIAGCYMPGFAEQQKPDQEDEGMLAILAAQDQAKNPLGKPKPDQKSQATATHGVSTVNGGKLVEPLLIRKPQVGDLRRTISFDGNWQIAEGTMATPPSTFDHTVPVPGLVDMATPAFEDVGIPSGMREAFWYRRTFTIEEPIPAVARLKVNKAMFGCKVVVNGKALGEQKVTFTPLYCDVKDVLRQGENEILIRVGAWLPDGKESIGWDQEKHRYIPGVFDSVELILSGAPHIDRVQAVPDVEKQAVTIHAWPVQPAHFIVREARSGKVVGEAEGTDKVTIPMPGCRLWSPEDPFLYEVVARTAGDELTARFGMRSFRLDPQTGHAVLNGKPYFMRGSNSTLYRFFEDNDRGGLPWDEAWVRNFHRRCKEMHWNCLRHSIGFPPEAWYRIADEEGILLQDEFPIWLPFVKPGVLNVDELAGYYRDWMQERWNHPSVVIWDACNETRLPETGAALAKVRDLDFSDRPWDNSWNRPARKTDSLELHTYHYFFDKFTTLEVLGFDPGTFNREPGDNPVINNEYCGLWFTREGAPTQLSVRNMMAFLNPKATTEQWIRMIARSATMAQDVISLSTKEQRFMIQARYLAADTEFYRAKRGSAAIMHFVVLAPAWTRAQTPFTVADNWSDVVKLEFEPHFAKYMRDAFAPVGLMVDNFVAEQLAGQEVDFPVVAFSDLDKPWKGTLRVTLTKEGKTLAEKTFPVALDAWGKITQACSLRMPAESGSCQVTATLLDTPDGPVSSLRDFTVTTPEEQRAHYGLAFQKPCTASSSARQQFWANPTEAGQLRKPGDSSARKPFEDMGPAAAVDRLLMTTWKPASLDSPQWLAVDLQSRCAISRVELFWKNKGSPALVLQSSEDGKQWTDIYKSDASKENPRIITFAPVTTRWLRLYLPSPLIDKKVAELRDFRVFEK